MAPSPPPIPLPRFWPRHAQAAFLHAVTLLQHAVLTALPAHSGLVGQVARLEQEIALLVEEARIKDARLARVPPRQRPHYRPEDRFAILVLRGARGWNVEETAKRFLVTVATIAGWTTRLDEEGKDALVRSRVPVNAFPDFVRLLVHQLAAFGPKLGKVRISQILARGAIHLSASTVRRWKKAPPRVIPPKAPTLVPPTSGRTVVASRSDHVWGIDLTMIQIAGAWTSWPPFAALPFYPFCWWYAVVLDQYSRSIVGYALFRRPPSGHDIAAMLDAAVARHHGAPKYIISDQGAQFTGVEYLAWCARHAVTPRYGAIGKHGSIAIVERFFLSLKTEAFGCLPVPICLPDMQALLAGYGRWYNEHRPHQGLGGLTPAEKRSSTVPARARPRFEPRARYPDVRVADVRRRRPKNVVLRLVRLEGAPHLPVVSLRPAA